MNLFFTVFLKATQRKYVLFSAVGLHFFSVLNEKTLQKARQYKGYQKKNKKKQDLIWLAEKHYRTLSQLVWCLLLFLTTLKT